MCIRDSGCGSYWDNSRLSSSRLACRSRMFHWIKDMIKRIGGYSASESPPPSISSTPYREYIAIGSSMCGGGRFIFGLPLFFEDEEDSGGWGSPWPPLLVEGIGAFAPLLLLGGGEGEVVFLCFLALFSLLWVCVVWLFVLTGTGVSAPCGHVNSVWYNNDYKNGYLWIVSLTLVLLCTKFSRSATVYSG